MLIEIENVKTVVDQNNGNCNDFLLFTVDVKAPYPSVKFGFLSLASVLKLVYHGVVMSLILCWK